jgi:hypothetical protein
MTDKIKVIYIAGWGRSGSTILSNILGNIDGFFGTGELRYVWERNLIENWHCGCHLPFDQCEFWKNVFNDAYGGMGDVDAHFMMRNNYRLRTRHLPQMLFGTGDSRFKPELSDYLNHLEKLYRSIQRVSQCNVIVDSSKFPSYLYVLHLIRTIDLYIIHLVRDPRAVAFSWQRKKLSPGSTTRKEMRQINPVTSSSLWTVWNFAIKRLWGHGPKYFFLRYEDFVAAPQETVRRIVALSNEPPPDLAFLDCADIDLKINHTTSGNPNRFETGGVILRPDEEWKSGITIGNRLIVNSLTWPLLLKWGYMGKDPVK